ncbi:arylsulfatase A-like enzyme [Paenibacillus sp. BK033]|uniref:sulfatase-like hydrolase/transferase n=1 Tax=Paenibacillus sp. BK033 TaxID=2512133 RepID=UPI001044BA69|nr:sulfatase-like hydrolase/transferase [Paenibacillus sp. BK033]TCM89761.1 arylsulfatase A-like enzyme [Paenibacillus sp. BK033]
MSKQPNVIVFFTDQQRWDTSGLHGNPMRLMPNFDREALLGTHLTHSFTCQPVCGPARSCLQMGQYATKTGCFVNGIHMPEDAPTIAKSFKASGYDTGYIGKWHLAPEEPVSERYRGGYDYWLAANVLEFSSDAYNAVMYDNGNNAVKLPGYRVDAITDAAIRYIDDHQDNPFFLFLSYLEPHHQNHEDNYPAPDGYREQYTGAWTPPDLAALGGSAPYHLPGYYGMVKRLDEAFGRLMDALKSLGLREKTIVLFTADHGCHFKTRNGEYKRSVHDASIRVPTLITGPGFMGGHQVQELVSLVDLPPTLLDAAGIPVPEHMQGRSIKPLINGNHTAWPEEVFIQISESEVGRAVRTRRWKYGVVARDKNPYTDSHSDRYEEAYLYDLQSDPYELTNLIGYESHAGVANAMRNRLLKRMVAAGEHVPEILLAPAVASGQRSVTDDEALN